MTNSLSDKVHPSHSLKKIAPPVLFAALLVAVFELYFAVRETIFWLYPHGKDGLLWDPRAYLMLEGLLRVGWFWLIFSFYRRNKTALQRAGRQVMLYAIGVAAGLIMISLAALIGWMVGLKIDPVWLARYRMMDVAILLLWGLSLLFLLLSSSIQENRWSRRWLYVMALAGAFVYFIQKGLVWLQMITGQYILKGTLIRLIFLVVPLIILLGRLALIVLFSVDRESGDTGAAK